MLPKLAIYTRFFVPVTAKLAGLTVVAQHVDGTEMEIASFTAEQLEATRATAETEGKESYGLVGQAVASAFPLPKAGLMKIVVRSGEAEEISGSLNIVAGE